jgi:phospholipid/cholesterol/gamma-HCH transport system substrate-binding protein
LKNKNEIKTGLLVITGIALFIFGYSYLKSNDIFVSDRTFYAVYDDVEGVVNGTPVTVNGFPVGSITDISFFKQNRLLVKFRVENDIKFSVNSLAQIYETGLIGGKALAIIPAMDNSRVAVSKDTLKSSVAPGLTDLVNEKLTPLQENIEMMIVSANNVLEKINSVFDDPTRSNLRTSVSDFSETISDLKETSVMIKSIVKTNKIAINNTIDNVKDLSEDLSSISNTINSSDLEKTLLNLKLSSENLSNVLENINNGDGSVSKLISNDSLFNNLNDASKSIDLLLEDIRLNPKRYIHFSIFGKKNKPYEKNND